MIVRIIERILQEVQYIHRIGFIYDSTKRTLMYTCTTGNAFIMIDNCFSVFVHFYRTYRACTHTGTHNFTDCTKRTILFTFPAFDAQFLMDISSVVYNGDRTFRTVFLTFMTQTATAGVTDYKTVDGTFIAGRIQNINYNIVFCRLQYKMHTVFNDMSFLINTAAEHSFRARNDRFRNI